jgi:hypothetical protein
MWGHSLQAIHAIVIIVSFTKVRWPYDSSILVKSTLKMESALFRNVDMQVIVFKHHVAINTVIIVSFTTFRWPYDSRFAKNTLKIEAALPRNVYTNHYRLHGVTSQTVRISFHIYGPLFQDFYKRSCIRI